MPSRMSTANFITLARLPLLGLVTLLLYAPGGPAAWLALGLLPVLYLMDWFDGFLARHRHQVSDLGGVLDIAMDRVVENVLWIVFAHQRRVPVWVPILFITRSFVVDGLRSYALAKGYSAFGMMRSSVGRFLVAGRWMRALYGLAKGLAFGALALGAALCGGSGAPCPAWLDVTTGALVYFSVGLCLLRGGPVLLDIRALIDDAPE
jgi:CDP-diacylglycerol---glycerol-3-phosphate 3-phosphatidyltransferase